jgi:hypothetical protein
MNKQDLKRIIKEEIRKVLKEAVAIDNDRESIEARVYASPAFENASPAQMKAAADKLFAEWKEVASNYPNVHAYLSELEKTGGMEGFLNEAAKPINTFNKVALGRMLTSIGFPVSDVTTQDRLMIVNFRTPLQNAQKFLDAYQTFKEENPGLTNTMPNIVNAKKVGDVWHFEMEA